MVSRNFDLPTIYEISTRRQQKVFLCLFWRNSFFQPWTILKYVVIAILLKNPTPLLLSRASQGKHFHSCPAFRKWLPRQTWKHRFRLSAVLVWAVQQSMECYRFHVRWWVIYNKFCLFLNFLKIPDKIFERWSSVGKTQALETFQRIFAPR